MVVGDHDTPWEVKDCDDIHSLQSAHGQADFQRVLAPNAPPVGLYLSTKNGGGDYGVENFTFFCERLLVGEAARRYKKVVLAKRVPGRSSEPLAAGMPKILAEWSSKDGLKWLSS